MKRLILFYVIFFMGVMLFAQGDPEHLTFKGVPIDGSLSVYVAKMDSAGFKFLREQDGTAILQGDFAGVKNCSVEVSTLKSMNIVCTIDVKFPACDNWSSLQRNYEQLKLMLTQKYGKPAEVVEEFNGGIIPGNNNFKMHELYMDRCTWFTKFETKNGDIQLSLQTHKYQNCFVLLKYSDRINTELVRSAAMDDL